MTKTTTKWTLESANAHLQNIMTENNIEHNFEILSAKNHTKNYYYIVEKKTGYNIMSWSWETLRKLMNDIENNNYGYRDRMLTEMKAA